MSLEQHDDVDAPVSPPAEPPIDPTMPPAQPPIWQLVPPIVLAALITAGLILGSQLERMFYAIGIGGLQALLAIALVWQLRARSPIPPVAVAVMTGLGAGAVAVHWRPVSLLPIAALLAVAFIAVVVVQLFQRDRRDLVDQLAISMCAVVGAVGFASYIALSRLGAAPPAMYTAVMAAGTAIVAARAIDMAMPNPRINRQVPRGAFGIVIGVVCGTGAAGYAGVVLEGPDPTSAAIGGLLVALVAVLCDLSASYLQAARRIDGLGTAWWLVNGLLGPLLAFALAGPVIYLLSAYYMVA
ncbi:hypothetical protein [Natronoglycomyces albus]|uniref:Uncharacterized protein n=1 Tax=Natronoglycomyces albus TaxID=2811108 RepID=A0A895XID5_9ACTN|nr:hypothetical protein [Natronoglycomyces albus]QSB05104.1 hypothetical protein JQS30_15300 [Natronoglycomyces albus]